MRLPHEQYFCSKKFYLQLLFLNALLLLLQLGSYWDVKGVCGKTAANIVNFLQAQTAA
jgi:hypothetical protein